MMPRGMSGLGFGAAPASSLTDLFDTDALLDALGGRRTAPAETAHDSADVRLLLALVTSVDTMGVVDIDSDIDPVAVAALAAGFALVTSAASEDADEAVGDALPERRSLLARVSGGNRLRLVGGTAGRRLPRARPYRVVAAMVGVLLAFGGGSLAAAATTDPAHAWGPLRPLASVLHPGWEADYFAARRQAVIRTLNLASQQSKAGQPLAAAVTYGTAKQEARSLPKRPDPGLQARFDAVAREIGLDPPPTGAPVIGPPSSVGSSSPPGATGGTSAGGPASGATDPSSTPPASSGDPTAPPASPPSEPPTTTDGSSAGSAGSTGGTTDGTTAGSTVGTTGGAPAGSTVGTTAGAPAGSTVGAVDGGTGATTSGTTDGTTLGTTQGTTDGTTVGTTTGAPSGAIGSATDTGTGTTTAPTPTSESTAGTTPDPAVAAASAASATPAPSPQPSSPPAGTDASTAGSAPAPSAPAPPPAEPPVSASSAPAAGSTPAPATQSAPTV